VNTVAQTPSRPLRAPGSRRILFPKEHGAYGQLLFPMVTALLLGSQLPLPGLGLALAFFLVFLLHEPLLVLLGHRGGRAREQFQQLARRQSLVLAVATVTVLACVAPWLSAKALGSILLPGAAAAGISVFVLLGKERTTAGELTAAAGLSACCVPIAVADGVRVASASVCWVIWAVVLMAATLAVRGVIARAKYGEEKLALWAVGLGAAGAALVAGMLPILALPRILLWAVAPAVALPLVLLVLKPSPKYLRAIGWSAMAVDFAIVGVLVAALR